MAQPGRLTSSLCRFRSALLVIGLVCALPWLAEAQGDLSREEAREKLNHTEQQLQSNQAKEQGLTQDLATLAVERAKLNNDLIDSGKNVQASEAKLSETEAKLAELTDQVNLIKNSITERKETIVKMLSAMQRIGRTPPPALVTRRDDALAVVRSAMLLADVFPELKYQADNLSRELVGMVTLENGIREQRDAEKSERDSLASEQARLDRLDAQIAKVEVAQYDAEIAAEKALRAREQQRALATPANESVVEIKPESTKVAFATPDRLKPAMPFEAAKGTLRLPVQGRRVKRFGDADASGGTVKGISLQTRPEARITAPADGWVVYAGEFRSYGQLLIINAGGGYHVLLAGMSRIDVSLGQFVLAGEPIGVMGGPAPANGSDILRPVLY